MNRSPRFAQVTKTGSANLESRKTTRITAARITKVTIRSADDLKYQRNGDAIAVPIVPSATPMSAVTTKRTAIS